MSGVGRGFSAPQFFEFVHEASPDILKPGLGQHANHLSVQVSDYVNISAVWVILDPENMGVILASINTYDKKYLNKPKK